MKTCEFEEFTMNMKEALEKAFGATYIIGVESLTKNNGIVKTGLWIREKGKEIGIVCYPEDYFGQCQDGEALRQLAMGIRKAYDESCPREELGKALCDFGWVKGHVICSLVNAGRNQGYLKQAPHIRVMDLAVVFLIDFGWQDETQMAARITNDHMKIWGTCLEELARLSVENTRKRYPAKTRTMLEIMTELSESEEVDETRKEVEAEKGMPFQETMKKNMERCPMYMINNGEPGNYGAIAMLYPGVLRELSERLGSDLTVLPSSVHEVLAVPYHEGDDINGIVGMVQLINRTEVPRKDVLSDQVYVYKREEGCLYLAKSSGKWEKGFFLDKLCGHRDMKMAG